MQFMFTYIRKPVQLTWVWRIFALTGRRVSTQPGEGGVIRSWTEQASWTPQPFSWSEAACLEDLQVCLFQITAVEHSPVLGKMGKPVSLTDLFLLVSAKWQPLLSPRKQRERLSSASHPTAPSWTNTMLREYLQTTFPACSVPQESTEAMILAL